MTEKTGKSKVTLLVIDDHPLFRQGVVDAISLETDLKVVGQASTGENAVDIIRSTKPAIVLLDVNLPVMNGQQIAHQVTLEKLRTQVVLMTGYDDVEQSLHAAMAGAAAYCAKDIEPKGLLRIIREVAAGTYVFGGQSMTRRELQKWIEEQIEAAPRPTANQEVRFIRFPSADGGPGVVVTGLSNKEIVRFSGSASDGQEPRHLHPEEVRWRTVRGLLCMPLNTDGCGSRPPAPKRAGKMNADLRARSAEIDAQVTARLNARCARSALIEQSQAELSKLAQRNASITVHLQQVQGRLEQTPPAELRMAYDAALDAQQRLFVMRGQLDKLQSDKDHLAKYRNALERIGASASPPAGGASSGPKGSVAEIEAVVNAQEAERQRLSRQMHDGPAQAMSNFILQTEIAMRLLDVDPAKVKDELTSLKTSALGTFQKLRNFIFELRPMMLDDLGLTPTIRKYVDAFRDQTGIEVGVTVTGTERRLEPYLEIMYSGRSRNCSATPRDIARPRRSSCRWTWETMRYGLLWTTTEGDLIPRRPAAIPVWASA
jgi:DNA-binding NarL/FixJ family response regulator